MNEKMNYKMNKEMNKLILGINNIIITCINCKNIKFNNKYDCICKFVILIQRYWRKYNKKNRKVLEPCNINKLKCLNIKYLKEIIKEDYLTKGRIEYYNSTSTKNYILEDGFLEYIVAKVIKGKRVGEGHSPIDIINID
jgi:hypothetical protein